MIYRMKNYDREAVENDIRRLFKDFTQGKGGSVHFPGGMKEFDFKQGEYDKRRLIRYVVGHVNSFKIYDRPIEKVNWEIYFYYKGIPAAVMHKKFGFFIYVDSSLPREDAEQINSELQKIIVNGLSIAEKVVREEALKDIKLGKIIIANKYHALMRMYQYFKKSSKRKPRDNTKDIEKMIEANRDKKSSKKELEETVRAIKKLMDEHSRPDEKVRFNEEAAYIAFFSLLEHLCMLCLPFSESKYMKDVYLFSKLNWADKFKEVFPLSDAEFKKSYDAFSNLAKYRRNASAHGYLDKMHTSFAFYFDPARHRIPAAIYDSEIMTQWNDKDTNFKELDDFLVNIHKHPKTKNRMAYIDYPFDVSFDPASVKQYKRINKYTERGLKQFIEAESWEYTNALNMDH